MENFLFLQRLKVSYNTVSARAAARVAGITKVSASAANTTLNPLESFLFRITTSPDCVSIDVAPRAPATV
jgi:hypothetical protein